MKSVISVLSLESEDDIEVSLQNKSVTLSSPKTTWLFPLTICPDGELAVPASLPNNVLSLPPTISFPVLVPTATFLCPVVHFNKASYPTAVLDAAVVFAFNAEAPTATQYEPVVLFLNVSSPTAVLCWPVVVC